MATAIRSHIEHCPQCKDSYNGLSNEGKDAADAVYKLYKLKSFENAFNCDGVQLPLGFAEKLEQKRELAHHKLAPLLTEERFKCHKLAHCTWGSRFIQVLKKAKL